jgi:hypothetical protein
VGADTLNLLEQEEAFQVLTDEQDDQADLDKAAEDASIIRFVNQVLGDAIAAGHRHSRGTVRGRAADPLPDRRHVAGRAGAGADQAVSAGHRVAHQDPQRT